METQKSSRVLDFILFAISLVAMIALLMFSPQWFWVALPFVLTFLTRFLGSM
jgi:hypothetical protein